MHVSSQNIPVARPWAQKLYLTMGGLAVFLLLQGWQLRRTLR